MHNYNCVICIYIDWLGYETFYHRFEKVKKYIKKKHNLSPPLYTSLWKVMRKAGLVEKNRYKKTHWISWIATLSQRNYIYILPKKATSLSPKRILLTILVTVALTWWSFYKSKLIKFYQRVIMLQERLSRLVIVSIEK